jgi:tight adherence protein B
MLRLNYAYVMKLFEDPLGQQMVATAIVLQVLGALVIRKIVNIRV